MSIRFSDSGVNPITDEEVLICPLDASRISGVVDVVVKIEPTENHSEKGAPFCEVVRVEDQCIRNKGT
jgi:hypothetical protein